MSQIVNHSFFFNLNKKRLSFLKKILIIFKINLLVITLFTSSAQATTSFVDSFSVALQENNPQGIAFNNDGTKMFVVGGAGDDVNEYALTTGFDVSTASFVNDFSVAAQETFPTAVAFNNDGTKMFVMGFDGDDVNEYTLSTGFRTSGVVTFIDSFSVALQDTAPRGLAFNNDGTKMFVSGGDGDDVNEYTLSTAFDVSTASFVDNFSVAAQDTGPTGLAFNNDGTKMFVAGLIGDDVNEYTLSTGFNLNNVLPTLSSSVPADNAIDVARDANIVLNFSESVTVQTGNITVKKTSDNSTVETFNVATSGLITGTGTSQITINPSLNFYAETEYYVLIDSTAFDDTDSGSYEGISSTTALSFTTADVSNPTLSSSTPANNATDVAVDSNIVLNFSESVDVETGNITIKKKSDDSTFETIDVTGAKVTGSGSSKITINAANDFVKGVEYYVLIDATAFDDSSNNSYAGISSSTALGFRIFLADPTSDKDVIGTIDVQSQLAKNFISQSTSTVSNRLSYLRQNRGNDNLSKNNIKFDFGNAILTSLTNELLAKNDKSIIPDNWSSWSEGSISVSKIGDSLGSSSSETDGQALAFGFDTKLNDNDLLGFAVQYGQSDTDIGSSGTNVDSENINVSVYRTRPLDNDNFIEGIIGVGLIESDLKRVSGANTLTGSRNGTQVFGSINYGKTLDKGDFNLTPIARVDLGYTELNAYSETGTDALSYAKQTIESGLASVGLQFSDIVKFNNNKLKPFGSIEYGMDFSNSSDAKMNYVSDTSTIYTHTQGANSNHLITSVVGFEYITINNLNIIASYKRIQGNESEQTDILNVSINFKSKQETEYAMSVDGSEDLKAGFDISKNINGFDLKFNANQAFNENSDQAAEISLSRQF